MRRMLFFLIGVAVGAALLIILSAGNGAGTPFGIGFFTFLTVGSAIGGRWGPGPIARGVRAPFLSAAGVTILVLCVPTVGLLLWRPFLGDVVPLGWFLLCMAVAGLLMIPVGRMGRDQRAEGRPNRAV
ncbi:hypothetical protein [Actinoplanes sp. G11-F43]|uniref:hypothetical protein n=1 Tax=Actinoplanes sp. G11-F43 TaxID=3424130 RepID=UPI003D34850D